MKTFIVSLMLLFLLSVSMPSPACTIFFIKSDKHVFGGNNEDWEDPYSKMWFYPPKDDTHGWIKFGWGSFPQGGMNDQGLFWDASSGPYLEMPESETNKEKYPAALMQKVIEECANIEEAIAIFEQYYCEDQYKAQYLLGDSSAYSIIVEGDNIVSIDGNYQILTNFYHSDPDLGGYPCWRHDAAEELLCGFDEPTPYDVGTVLASTHQEGRYPTQYSSIYDLKNGIIYLFYFHNYEEFIIIDLEAELSKGYRSYDIPDLFSRIKLQSPDDGTKISSTSVTLTWEGIEGSSYELVYSTDHTFSADKSLSFLRSFPELPIQNSKLPIQFGFVWLIPGLLIVIPFYRKRRLIVPLVLILFVVLYSYQCRKEEIMPLEVNTVNMSETISNLLPNTTYYWKIRAISGEQNNFLSETITRSFSTQ